MTGQAREQERASLTAARSASVRTSRGRRRNPPRSGWCPGAGLKRPPHRKPPPGGSEREISARRSLRRLEVQVWEPCWAFPLLLLTFGGAGAPASESDDSSSGWTSWCAQPIAELLYSNLCLLDVSPLPPPPLLKKIHFIFQHAFVPWHRNNPIILLLFDLFFTDEMKLQTGSGIQAVITLQ